VEKVVSRLEGRPVVLSPRDWALVSAWWRTRVPLGTVLEALERATRRRRSSSRSILTHAAAELEEVSRVMREGRATSLSRGEGKSPSLEGARRRWEAAEQRAEQDGILRETLARLLDRLDLGEDPAALDIALDDVLLRLAPEELRVEVTKEMENRLGPFRGMREGALLATIRRAMTDRLRVSLDLPRLALCDRDNPAGPR
jgi:hypothetical protein